MATTNRFRISNALTGMALVLLLQVGMTLPTFAQEVHRFDIDTTDAAAAIHLFGNQSGVQILASAEVLAGRKLNQFSGDLSTDDGFKQLLAGSGLEHRYVGERAVAVISGVLGEPANASGPELALGTTNESEKTNSPSASTVAVNEKVSLAQDAKRSSSVSEPTELEEILVTGTHIRGVTKLPMPALRFERLEIERAGYSRVEELFRTLPQNQAELTSTSPVAGASDLSSSNVEKATAINLRGLGAQSTLVLLNGQRRPGSVQGRVVDISAIPLSVIERVEVVTGGRSAIYGSDAVAGVVNLVTRRDFKGAETSVYYGGADEGAEQLQLSQIFGRSSYRGGFVAAYDYAESWNLDATDAGIVYGPSIFGIVPVPGRYDILPNNTRHSGFLSGRYSISENVEIYGDGLYTSSDNNSRTEYVFPGVFDFAEQRDTVSDQFSIAPGVRIDLTDSWRLAISGLHGEASNEFSQETTFGSASDVVDSKISSVSAIADGSVFSGDLLEVKTAFGAEHRWESVRYPDLLVDGDRQVRSLFAEFLFDIQPDRQNARNAVQLSVAGRYSDYSDFGDTFDPQFGVMWNAGGVLTLRGAYSTAFRAPDLYTLSENAGATAILFPLTDSLAPTGVTTGLIWFANNAALEAEEATTWSVGADLTPTFAPTSTLSVSYFEIDYDERIDIPAPDFADWSQVLVNEGRYPELLDRAPTATALDAIIDSAVNSARGGFGNNTGQPFDPATQSVLDVFPDAVLFDNRYNNVAIESMRGVDLALDSTIETGGGNVSFGFNAVYYLDFERKVTSASAAVSRLNAPGKPVDFRIRSFAGWQGPILGAFVYFNYMDGYEDILADPITPIDSWTTVDVSVSYGSPRLSVVGLLNGFSATLAVRNIFDKAPPKFLSDSLGIGFDSANADALGRFVSLQLVKRW